MSNQNQLAVVKKSVIDVVAKKIQEFQGSGELQLPADYSAANAMKAAFLILQDTVDRNKKPVLEVCTQNSIANALLSMVVQGLNPDKKQLYFIAYGQQLTAQRSSFGAMALAKRVDPTIETFAAEVIYEGDTLKYEIVRGQKVIVRHEQEFGNIDKAKIVGAYCMVIGTGGEIKSTVLMTFDEIKQAWKQSKMNPIDDKGNVKASGTHGKFTAEMCIRTATNKACKPIINSSSDATILGRAIKEAEAITVEAELAEEVSDNANKIAIDIKPEPGEPGSVVDAEFVDPDPEQASPVAEAVKGVLETTPPPGEDENPFGDEEQPACGF